VGFGRYANSTHSIEGGSTGSEPPSREQHSRIYLRRCLVEVRFEVDFAALRFGEGFAFLALKSQLDEGLLCLKMLSGRYAETIQFGASTISLIFKSTAAPHRQ
jgi:hypothetical protein